MYNLFTLHHRNLEYLETTDREQQKTPVRMFGRCSIFPILIYTFRRYSCSCKETSPVCRCLQWAKTICSIYIYINVFSLIYFLFNLGSILFLIFYFSIVFDNLINSIFAKKYVVRKKCTVFLNTLQIVLYYLELLLIFIKYCIFIFND